MRMSLKQIVKAGLAVTAMVVAGLVIGCSDDDNSGGGDDNGGGGGGGSGLVGEWRMVERSYTNSYGESDTRILGDDEYAFLVFSSPNKLKETYFEKVGNFWLESFEDFPGTWSTNGQTLYMNYDDGEIDAVTYNISNNTLTVTSTYTDDDEDGGYSSTTITTLTRTSVASVRGTLGTVYTRDQNLYSYTGIRDLAWESLDDSDIRIDFDSNWFSDGEYYFTGYYDRTTWYTNNNNTRVFLVGMEVEDESCWYEDIQCTYTIAETVELAYSFKTVGGEKQLVLRLVGPGGTLGSEETYKPYDLSNGYDYAPAKSRDVKKSKAVAARSFWVTQSPSVK
jgi:hypothetical protein